MAQRPKTQSSTPTPVSVTPVIAFLDVDSFECQIWQKKFPNTKGKPCVVATQSGLILAATYEAKALGISRSLTPDVKMAKKFCPELHVFFKPNKWGKQDQSKLRKTTAEIVKHIKDFIANKSIGKGKGVILQVASADEFYLDISGEVTRGKECWMKANQMEFNSGLKPGFPMRDNIVWERANQKKCPIGYYKVPREPKKDKLGMLLDTKPYAYRNEERLMFGALFLDRLCDYLFQKTGLQVSGGVAKNKLLAKVGGSLNKPKKITVFTEDAIDQVFATLKIGAIPGLGGPIGEKLREEFTIEFVGDIKKIPFQALKEKFGQKLAQIIWSLATGQDVSPVLPKICKDQMKYNKSSGDIRRLAVLEKVLKNLAEETAVILSEDAEWYNRTTSEVRVDYKFEETKKSKGIPADGHVFQIKDASSPMSLGERVKEWILNLQDFDKDDFLCSSLSFTLKNFFPIGSSVEEQLSSSNEDLMHGSIPTSLRVHTLASSSTSLPVYSHRVVGSFRITTNLKYDLQNTATPTLLPNSTLNSLIGYNLRANFRPNKSCQKLIRDYITYNEVKHMYFSQWLRNEKPGILDLEDIKFVSFQGRLLRALKTPLNSGNYGEWESYAMNLDGVIYLWEELTVPVQSGPNKPCNVTSGNYMREVFEQIVTGRNPKPGDPVDGINKVFPIQKASFGSHKLLLLCNVDAQHEDGQFAQIQLQKQEVKKDKLTLSLERNMKVWSKSVVSGSKSVIIAHMNIRNRITKIETLSVDDITSTIEKRDTCLIFVDRFLSWLKVHLPVHNTKLVKKFAWIIREDKVVCSTVPEEQIKNLIIPKFYAKK